VALRRYRGDRPVTESPNSSSIVRFVPPAAAALTRSVKVTRENIMKGDESKMAVTALCRRASTPL
jgi:hypothetical protein